MYDKEKLIEVAVKICETYKYHTSLKIESDFNGNDCIICKPYNSICYPVLYVGLYEFPSGICGVRVYTKDYFCSIVISMVDFEKRLQFDLFDDLRHFIEIAK